MEYKTAGGNARDPCMDGLHVSLRCEIWGLGCGRRRASRAISGVSRGGKRIRSFVRSWSYVTVDRSLMHRNGGQATARHANFHRRAFDLCLVWDEAGGVKKGYFRHLVWREGRLRFT